MVPRSVGGDRRPEAQTDATHLVEKGGGLAEGIARDLTTNEVLLEGNSAEKALEEVRLVGVTLLLAHPNEEKNQETVLAKIPETDLDLAHRGSRRQNHLRGSAAPTRRVDESNMEVGNER